MASSVLLVDDDQSNLDVLSNILQREGLHVAVASSGNAALEHLASQQVDLVITDLKMPGMDGFELLKKIKAGYPLTEVIVVTAHGTIEKAVAAIKNGAYDFVAKPFDRISIVKQVSKALEKQDLLRENQMLRQELAGFRAGNRIVGSSDAIKSVTESVEQAAASDATVLVLGESGTGKEVIARLLHLLSNRKSSPFIKVTCTNLPENLLEAELFGYERGAFTGATGRKQGRFEVADGGTLFLDEIGDLPLSIQGKLLRALQEGEFERLGSNSTIAVDVRIVAATNRDLFAEVQSGRFREDLFYRLNVIQIKIPPLRERQSDIPLLANHFLKLFNSKNGKSVTGINDDTMKVLMTFSWPGNVRQLENTIERAVVFAKGETIATNDLPELVEPESQSSDGFRIALGTPMKEIEKRVIEETLRQTGGDKARAAKILGIGMRTIYRKLEQPE